MNGSPLLTRAIQTVGISTSLILSGIIMAGSLTLTPRLLESPTPLLLRQWDNMYEQGKTRVGPVAVIPALSYFYLAYQEHTAAFSAPWKVNAYIAAGLFALAIAPYTLVIMKSTNGKLTAKAAETRALERTDVVVEIGLGAETAHKLLDFWALLNLGRGSIVAISGVLGLWTALN